MEYFCFVLLYLILIVLHYVDGVDFRTFPHLIRGKSISNQLHGLLEVVQLHFNCVQKSDATRIDSIDSVVNGPSNVVIEDVIMMPKMTANKGKDEELVSCPRQLKYHYFHY